MHTALKRVSCLTRFAVGALALAAFAAGPDAHAQAAINHNKALAGGVTPGDAAGYPIRRSVAGSYKLTGNLVVPAGVNGIEIAADNVTLDLNGFSIRSGGVSSHNGTTFEVVCNGGGAGHFGVYLPISNVSSAVRNGTVQGFSVGVLLEGGIAESLVVKHNGTGVASNGTLQANRVTGIVAELNQVGVLMPGGLIERSVASSNGVGFQGSDAGVVAVSERHAGRNVVGIKAAAVRGSRANLNKTDLVSTVPF